MGIYDRDYARANAPSARRGGMFRRGPGGPLSFSVTNWIIIINVLVFVVDALIGARYKVEVSLGERYAPPPPTAKEHATYVVDRSKEISVDAAGGVGHPIFAPDGHIVGFEKFTRMRPLEAVGHFSTGKGFVELQVWRLITFQFLHAGIDHLALNMLGLFFFGPIVERYLGGGRRYFAFYLICGIFGALMYLTLNLLGAGFGVHLRGLLFDDIYTPLIGASAGIFGVLIACAFVAGDAEMLLFMVVPIKVRTGAYLMVAIALGSLLYGSANAGGEAAHIGGALAGAFFIRRPHLLREFFDFFGTRSKIALNGNGSRRSVNQNAQVDRILEKVFEHGRQSLTEAEEKVLRDAGRREG